MIYPPTVSQAPWTGAAHPTGWHAERLGEQEAGLLAAAYDHRRLARLAARWAPDTPILVVTVPSLLEARRMVGAHASALELLQAVASFQGLRRAHRWQHPAFAGRFLEHVLQSTGTDRSFAFPAQRIVFVAVQGGCLLDPGGDPAESARLAAELMTLHEVGHVVEVARRLTLAPGMVPELQPIGHGALVGRRLMWLVRRHAEECFADAFACSALLASGVAPERLAMAYASFSSGDRQRLGVLLAEGFGDTPELRADLAIYQTFGAAALALRRTVATCPNSLVLQAWQAARRGALPPDELLRLTEGDGAPGWLADFDRYGAMAAADRRRANLRIWPGQVESLLRVLRGIPDPGARALRRQAMTAALRRRGLRLDAGGRKALVASGATALQAELRGGMDAAGEGRLEAIHGR